MKPRDKNPPADSFGERINRLHREKGWTQAERDPAAVEAALHDPHPAPARLNSFLCGELSREDNRAVVRHLLTGCPDCSAVLRPRRILDAM